MAYEVFKKIVSIEEYFSTWESKELNELNNKLKDNIYEKYKIKCKVFIRDNFICQQVNCLFCKNEKHASNLTIHHVKFQKNGGKHKERNEVTLCRPIHKNYHEGRKALIFSNAKELPAHIRGHTFKLSKEEKINWKKIRAECKALRKKIISESTTDLRKYNLENIKILLKWLEYEYNDYS